MIVFVIGGGNYVEYQNINDYGKSKGLSRITYGCTELVNPKQFTDQVKLSGIYFQGFIFSSFAVADVIVTEKINTHVRSSCDTIFEGKDVATSISKFFFLMLYASQLNLCC